MEVCQDECKLPFDAHCRATDSGWLCTRKREHDGPHVACGGGQGHAFHIWTEHEAEAQEPS